MRFALLCAAAVVAGFVGCSVVNVADDPLEPQPIAPTGGSATTSSSTTSGSTSTGAGGSGGSSGTCDDATLNGDETDVDCGGSCEPCAAGLRCRVAADCATGFCPADDGVCCATPCDDLCQACAESKTGVGDGTCADVVAATDPDLECTASAGPTCGASGQGCDGDGGCLLHGPDVTCEPPSCTNGVATAAGHCNGNGTCVPGATTPCAPYTCDVASCRTSCGSNNDCVPPAICNLQLGICQQPVTFSTHNFAGYTEYPLDPDLCGCCGATTTAQTAQAFCVLAGMSSVVSWTIGPIVGTNCYCWNCITNNTWASNCCGGQASRPMILTVTCL